MNKNKITKTKRNKKLKYLFTIFMTWFFLLPLFSSFSYGENFEYGKLQTKDYDEMLSLIQKRIQKAKKTALQFQSKNNDEEGDRQAIEQLRDTLKLILSRPNEDNMISKLLPGIRAELNNFNAYEDTLTSLAQEAIRAIKNEKLGVVFRGSACFILENIMSEIRPEINNKEDFKKLLIMIRDSKVTVPDVVKNERVLRSMYKTKNPSEIAEKILKEEEIPANKINNKPSQTSSKQN